MVNLGIKDFCDVIDQQFSNLLLHVPSAILLLVFTGHVIKTKRRNHSINKVKNLGYGR